MFIHVKRFASDFDIGHIYDFMNSLAAASSDCFIRVCCRALACERVQFLTLPLYLYVSIVMQQNMEDARSESNVL